MPIDHDNPTIADPRGEAIDTVLVVGGGTAGWMAATMLATTLSRNVKVKLVESDAIGIVGVGEATIPPVKKFNKAIQLDEREFLAATNGTFKLGIEFHNWARQGDRYLHQFGFVGRELDAIVKLHHWWLVGQLAGEPNYPAWEDIFVAKAAARADRFALPERRPGSPLSKFAYAYHFDAHLYGQYLRTIAEKRGVERIEGTIGDVALDPETGNVRNVVLQDGRSIEADLFIDCSGFRSLVLGQALGEEYEDWSKWLPADRALAVPTKRGPGGLTPYTKGIAHSVGWQWRIPLQHRTGNGHVFSSAFSEESEAEERLLATVDSEPLDTPRLIKFQTGRRPRAWVKNVIGLGLSAGFLEPLESTSIHMVQTGLERLIELFPTRRIDPILRNRYNMLAKAEWEQVRDFIIAHYKVTERQDSEFWRYTAAMDIPDTLAETLGLWKQRATLAVAPTHLFQLGSWSSMLIGQRLLPSGVHALADRADPKAVASDMRRIVREVEAAAQQLPPHADFIAQYCPAPAPMSA